MDDAFEGASPDSFFTFDVAEFNFTGNVHFIAPDIINVPMELAGGFWPESDIMTITNTGDAIKSAATGVPLPGQSLTVPFVPA